MQIVHIVKVILIFVDIASDEKNLCQIFPDLRYVSIESGINNVKKSKHIIKEYSGTKRIKLTMYNFSGVKFW